MIYSLMNWELNPEDIPISSNPKKGLKDFIPMTSLFLDSLDSFEDSSRSGMSSLLKAHLFQL